MFYFSDVLTIIVTKYSIKLHDYALVDSISEAVVENPNKFTF